MKGMKRGLLVGLLLAVIVFLLPDGVLGGITVGTGLAALLPQAAPPLGTTARLALAFIGLLVGFVATFLLLRRRRPEWDYDENTDAAPLSASEQMVVAPVIITPPQTPVVAPPGAPVDAKLDERLARIEALLADVSPQPAGTDASAALLERVATLETQIGGQLAAIEARLARPETAGSNVRTGRGSRRAPKRMSQALADIRRSIDGL